MKGIIASTVCIFLLLLIFKAPPERADAADTLYSPPESSHQEMQRNSPHVSTEIHDTKPAPSASHPTFYPERILLKLRIEPSGIAVHQSEYTDDPIHKDWMNHVDDALPKIYRNKRESIDRTHTSLLFMKNKMDSALLTGTIDKQEYTTLLAELIKWFQEANQSVLSVGEYNTLFGISGPDDPPISIHLPDGELGFPVINPAASVEIIKKKFDGKTITDITRFYRQHSQELSEIRKIYETDEFSGVGREQVKMDMLRIEKELTARFQNYCRNRLSEEQFKLLFGNNEK